MTLIRLYICICLGLGVAVEGYAPHYSKGLMSRVAARRGMQPAPCMISSDLAPIGSFVWIWGVRTRVLRHCKVVDLSEKRDKKRHADTRRIAEISWETVDSICGNWGASRDCPIIVFRLAE